MTTIYDELAYVFEHLNSNHDDTVVFIARHLAGEPAAAMVDAQLKSASPDGITIACRRPDGSEYEVQHRFGSPPQSLDEVRGQLFGLLEAARSAAEESVGLTSLEREIAGTNDLTTVITSVVALRDLTPNLRQITFGGGLDDYASIGGDQFLYVLLPPVGRSELSIDANFSWAANEETPEQDRPQGAYYTVRRWRPDDGEIDMWFVLHGHAGPASAWAARAEIGAPAGLWGPRSTFAPPPDTDRYLLVVDDTGLGAAAAVLDQLSDSGPAVDVIAETVDAGHVVDLPQWDGVNVEWCFRDGQPAGTAGLLIEAVRRRADDAAGLYALGAAESREVTAVRRHLRNDVGMAPDQVAMTGYWRR
ncbi:MAG: siderophore-interacting protein [Actinomycetota bacterium]